METLSIIQPKTAVSLNNTISLDFENNAVQVLNLETLKRTHLENDVQGRPLKGIYHYQFIEGVAALCRKSGLDYEIEEIFAAQNKNRQFPGVVVLPQVEEIKGEKAVEAHILRRVFSTIKINDSQDEETTTTLALSFHQDGIQAAIGPCVKICHNQCILSAERITANYGANKVSTEEVFQTVQMWLNDFFRYRETDKRIIDQMKQIRMNLNDVYQLIGLLTSLRIMHDSDNKEMSAQVKCYPLNQSQISMFTDSLITHIWTEQRDGLTLWDVYNFATELYKPQRMEIPNLIPQNLSLMETLINYYDLRS
jgi:hypothetical protein